MCYQSCSVLPRQKVAQGAAISHLQLQQICIYYIKAAFTISRQLAGNNQPATTCFTLQMWDVGAGTSQGKPRASLWHPCVLGGEPAEKPGLSPGTYSKGSAQSSKFLRVRLFLTSKFLGVTQEEEIT